MYDGYLPIADYGVIGDLSSVALVGLNGSIDWCCLPELDSPSVFAAILDHRRGGRFQIRIERGIAREQHYLEGTNILETSLSGEHGRLRIIDFMPLGPATADGHGGERPPSEIHRLLCCDEGEVHLEVEWSPRFDYARASTRIERVPGGFVARAESASLSLGGIEDTDARIRADELGPVVAGRFRLRAGERRVLVSRFAANADCDLDRSLEALRETAAWWRGWTHACDPSGECAFEGPLHDQISRSGLVLKLLTHRDSGAIAAAPTCSLPELIGGVRNWDYRYSWIRDSSFVAQALFALGHRREARGFLEWVEEVSWSTEERGYDLQIMYGLHGGRDLREIELDHLEGYRGSRPVRIGNAAAEHLQLDIFGEVIGAAYELVRMGGRLGGEMWGFLAAVADQACDRWKEPDQGIWEVRSPREQFVFSKVMVWVALDRAIRLAEQHGLPGRVSVWRRECAAIHRAVLEEGFDKRVGAFVRSFDSSALDASNLLLPILDFLPPEDPRVQGTIDRTMAELMENGMVRRYRAEDGLPGGEGTFVLCTYWLVDALTVSGRLEEAGELFDSMTERRNHLGLLPEEIDSRTGQFLGNCPQAFSHAGFVNSALHIARAHGRPWPGPPPMGSREHRRENGDQPNDG